MIASAPKEYASESGHFYWPDGRPAHEQENKSKPGTMRPTTLRDAKKLGLYPSVSGILGIQAKPGLSFWMKDQVARAAWTTENCGDCRYGEEDWVSDVLKTAEENMSKARDLGTEIHGAIEHYLRWLNTPASELEWPPDSAYSEHIKGAIKALKEIGVWGQPFGAERSFASPLGYGGCIDLYGENWVVDFKCVDSLEKKLDYPDRISQLVAYCDGRHGEDIHTWQVDRLWNCFISTSEPGKYLLREYDFREKFQGRKLFDACFALWKVVNQYDPLDSPPLNAGETLAPKHDAP